MRDHVAATLTAIAAYRDLLRDATTNVDIAATAIDIIDRLEEERAWLRSQPLSALRDDGARDFMTRYRLTVTRAVLFGERYLFLPSSETRAPWIEQLDELHLAVAELDGIEGLDDIQGP